VKYEGEENLLDVREVEVQLQPSGGGWSRRYLAEDLSGATAQQESRFADTIEIPCPTRPPKLVKVKRNITVPISKAKKNIAGPCGTLRQCLAGSTKDPVKSHENRGPKRPPGARESLFGG
jgi:hypothetical protein